MKVLVTGGLGLIGSHLVMRLLKEGHQVRVLDIRDFQEWPFRPARPIPMQVDFIQGDVADIYTCHRAMQGMDVVFHTAAIARTAETIGQPLRAHAVNVTGTLNLLQIAAANGVKRFVYSSSSIVYVGNTTPYAVGKKAAEDYVSLYHNLYHLSTISLRYANVFGPGQRTDGEYPNVLAAFSRDKKEKGYITIYGDGSVRRSFIHVDDVVEANMLAMEKSEVSGAFDIASDFYHSIGDIALLFDCEIRYAPERLGDTKIISLNGQLAEEKLGFKPHVKFKKENLQSYL